MHTYIQNNPHIYAEFKRIAFQMKNAGLRPSSKGIFEQMRRGSTAHENNSHLKINNDYTALLARQLVADHPNEFAALIQVRRSRFDALYSGPNSNAPTLF